MTGSGAPRHRAPPDRGPGSQRCLRRPVRCDASVHGVMIPFNLWETLFVSEELISALHAIVGDAGLKTAGDETAPFLTDWHGQYQGRSLAVVMPETTEQVSQVMALADRHDIVVVPQGGNTGFMGGATPDADGRSILLSLRRMNRIREMDPVNMSMTVEAGCVLQSLHDATEQQGLYFPLNLAAKGSCTIGGNLGTNAGGLNVVRYGTTRELTLGVEVVLMGGVFSIF